MLEREREKEEGEKNGGKVILAFLWPHFWAQKQILTTLLEAFFFLLLFVLMRELIGTNRKKGLDIAATATGSKKRVPKEQSEADRFHAL